MTEMRLPDTDGTTLIRRDDRQWIQVTGADRADYLHRMVTQDVVGIGPAQARPACLLNPRGRILADLLIWNAGDHYWLDLPREAEGAVAALEKYVIMEDTAFVPAPLARLDVFGAEASAFLEAAGLPVPDRYACRQGTLAGIALHVVRADLGRRPRYILQLPTASVADVVAELEAQGASSGSMADYHVVRIEEGVPEFGPELGEDVLFNEVGLRSAVSWAKGCFPGQEPVVMAMDRGRAPRSLCVLAAGGSALPEPGETLKQASGDVGHITSAAQSPAAGGIRALGFVSHAVAHVGEELQAAGGASLRIVRVHRLTRS